MSFEESHHCGRLSIKINLHSETIAMRYYTRGEDGDMPTLVVQTKYECFMANSDFEYQSIIIVVSDNDYLVYSFISFIFLKLLLCEIIMNSTALLLLNINSVLWLKYNCLRS